MITPRVSIGMPVWNGESYIRHGIEALLGQTFTDLELVISDNASTDGTQAICEEYGRRDPRVRYVRNEVNVGLQGNFARVLDLATGTYFMWGCHDDHWDPTYVARMVEVLDRHPEVVLAGSNSASIDQHGSIRLDQDQVSIYSFRDPGIRAYRFIRQRPGLLHASLIYGLMRTPAIKRVGFVPMGRIRIHNRGYYAIDLVTLFKLLFEGEFHVEPATLYFHRDPVVPPGPRGPGVAGRLGWGRVPRTGHAILDAFGYYGDLREILADADLSATTKEALIRTTWREQLRFPARLLGEMLSRRLRGPRP